MKKEELLNQLKVDPKLGLTETEAETQREKFGYNELDEAKRTPIIVKFLAQFKDILIIILIIAAIVPLLIDPTDYIESIIILFVVIINAVLGVYQENKAEKSLEALKKMSSPLAKVKREGNIYQIESRLLVPGDIIIVEAGDFIPADARILSASNLSVDESALTGESVSVNKTSDDIVEAKALGDQKNMLFSSTFATYGKAEAVVVNTGMKTEIGKIANMLNQPKESLTPLQVKLNQIGKVIGIVAILICVVVFAFEWIIDPDDVFGAFKSSVALAVAAIPEGLSTVVVVVLAIGVEKMAKQNAIVKKLPAVETLGSTSVVCSDKTGTLTQNKMTVVKVFKNVLKDLDENISDDEKEIVKFFAICTDASVKEVNGEEKRVGDPTETALIDAYNKYTDHDVKDEYPRIEDLPFDSDRKMMSVIIEYNGKLLCITKGAPDVVLSRSINKKDKEKFLNANENMAKNALRVLGIGVKYIDKVPQDLTSETLENDLTFLGLVGMIDPSRPEVKEAIKIAKSAGIRTIMITGDHVVTANAIANELGIIEENTVAISSEELHKLSDEELENNIEKYSVYARVAPEDKVRIVKAWQKKDKVVAMTGDGVNDSPALKQADIGCAMGITGTDVAKEASSMILTDDNFATIISAVKEGRGIYKNIKKTVQYLLSSNIGEVITIFVASVISLIVTKFTGGVAFGIPLLPIHLLWINLITDSLPSFALGLEKPESDVMKVKPRDKKESFFAHHLGLTIVWQGILIGTFSLTAYILGHNVLRDPKVDPEGASVLGHTMAFITLSMLQLFHSFSLKSEKSIFTKQVLDNKFLWGSFLVGVLLQFIILYVPSLARVFELDPLSFTELLICLGLAFSMVIVMEIYKAVKRSRK